MGTFSLKRNSLYGSGSPASPLLLVILDGVGIAPTRSQGYAGNALDIARTPALDRLMVREHIYLVLKAHGTAVGLPSDDDMGNSEVGHNAIGAGRVFTQGAKLVNEAIERGTLFQGQTWMDFIGNEDRPGYLMRAVGVNPHSNDVPALHFIGLLSDGNVHSHIDHLVAMVQECGRIKLPRLFVHTLLDGRDVEEVSAERYLQRLENLLEGFRSQGLHYYIASGGGRMVVTMDRYEANWDIVRRGWQTHVLGNGPQFDNSLVALDALRQQNPGIIDQDLPPFVIVNEHGQPRGPIRDGDVVIFFNFRGDRAIEISRAFSERDFASFDRERFPEVKYAGMMEYDGDLHIPSRYLVEPPELDRTISEYFVHNGLSTFALSETQKFGHVTYFWNGNNSEKFDEKRETWIEVPSDRIAFEKRPAMKAFEITDCLLEALGSRAYQFLRVNFPNGDMVGHTGKLDAAVQAIEAVDRNLARILTVVDRLKYNLVITADHGNCDQMFEVDKKTGAIKYREDGLPMAKTSHTLSPVPFIIHGPQTPFLELNRGISRPGLANIAATLMTLLGFQPPADYEPPLISTRDQSVK